MERTKATLTRRQVLAAVGASAVASGPLWGWRDLLPRASAAPLYNLQLPGVISYELNLPSLVAYANGYFARQGIDLTSFVTGSGGTLRAGMIAKQWDFGLFGFIHIPLARLAGSPWKAVLSCHDLEIFSLVVRRELEGQVRTVADLRGRKVGFSTPGAASWYMGELFLKKAGLDPNTDVQYISLGGDPAVIYTALKTGKVDAFIAWEPTTTRVIAEGIAYALIPIWRPEVHAQWIGKKALSMLLVTREDVIARNPGIVRRVVEAHRMALEFIRQHSPEDLADAVMKTPMTEAMFKGLDRRLIVEMFHRIKPGFGTGCLSRAGFEVEMKLAVDYKLVKRPITFEEFADTKFAGACP
jgi:NitT/TauT family transport system substrate-binding protein